MLQEKFRIGASMSRPANLFPGPFIEDRDDIANLEKIKKPGILETLSNVGSAGVSKYMNAGIFPIAGQEPLSELQRKAEAYEYAKLLEKASLLLNCIALMVSWFYDKGRERRPACDPILFMLKFGSSELLSAKLNVNAVSTSTSELRDFRPMGLQSHQYNFPLP